MRNVASATDISFQVGAVYHKLAAFVKTCRRVPVAPNDLRTPVSRVPAPVRCLRAASTFVTLRSRQAYDRMRPIFNGEFSFLTTTQQTYKTMASSTCLPSTQGVWPKGG